MCRGMVIVAIESGAFEDDRGAASDLAFQRVFLAFRAGFEVIFGHFLELFKLVSAAGADIIISRHFF